MIDITINNKIYSVDNKILNLTSDLSEINIPINITCEIDYLNLYCEFDFKKDFLLSLTETELAKMICLSENLKIDLLTEQLCEIIKNTKIKINSLHISEELKYKIIESMKDIKILEQSFDLLRGLNHNPTQFSCLDALFGLKSKISLNELMKFKEDYEKYFEYKTVYIEFEDYKKYLVKLMCEDDYYFPMNVIVSDIKLLSDNEIYFNGDIGCEVDYPTKWYMFLEWCILNNKDFKIILDC